MIHKDPVWDSENAVAFRKFLESGHGQRFIARLHWLRPDFSPSRDATARLIESGYLEGYEACVSAILTMLSEAKPLEEHPGPVDNYPPLDNDAAWTETDEKT